MAEIEHHGEGDIVKGDKIGVQVNQGPYSTYIEQQTIQYIDHTIQRLLTGAPFVPDVFEGRDGDYAEIDSLLHQDSRPLLLLNGEGGIGKTSLAAYYWQRQLRNYQHFAWLYVQDSVENALLGLAHALHIHAVPGEDAEALLARLLAALGNLAAPSLLVLDNVNDPTELQRRYPALAACANLHVLYTTRCAPLQHTKAHQVAPLDRETALQVFKRHYPGHQAEDDALFDAVYDALGGNTLVLELLAKNLASINADKTFYPFTRLVQELQAAGLFALSQTAAVDWVQAGPVPVMAAVDPLDVLRALYDGTRMPQPLEEPERSILSNLAILPAENLAFADLLRLLAIPEEREQAFSQILKGLAQRGWIEGGRQGAARHYRISPVVQHIIRERQAERLWGDVERMVDVLNELLAYQGGTGTLENISMTEAVAVIHWAEAVAGSIMVPHRWVSVLCERIGSYHVALGLLARGQGYYKQALKIDQDLVAGEPENLEYRDDLAISYCKLGDTHKAMGELDMALTNYKENLRLIEEVHAAHPGQDAFKNGLASSYGKLGEIYAILGQLDSALWHYQNYYSLTEELYVAHPGQVAFKNGLAVSYEKLGDTYAALGHLNTALGYYLERNRIAGELHAANPSPVDFKNGLAISYEKLGDTYTELGQLDIALGHYREYNRMKKELHTAHPGHLAFKNGLAISYWKLGVIARDHQGDPAAAKSYFQQAERAWAELVRDAPAFVAYQRNLGIVREALQTLEDQAPTPP